MDLVGVGLKRVSGRLPSLPGSLPIVAGGLLLILGASTAGCSTKGSPTASVVAHPGAGDTSTQKPTPQQEAAKQRAIQEGPAIEAATKLQQGK